MKENKKQSSSKEFFDEKSYYQNKMRNNYESAFWRSQVGANKRYDAIISYVDFSVHNVMDVGCGDGALLRRLIDKGIKPQKYTGMDIVPEFIFNAISSGIPGEFMLGDILDREFTPSPADWVVSVGLFGHKQENEDIWTERFDAIIKFMWENAQEGVAFTLTSTWSPNRNEDAHYCEPCFALGHVQKALSVSAVLDHSYLRNDFLILAKKNAL